jgi:predicted DNA-binding protein (UPF0251 family)
METERIALNQRERDRLRVLHEIRRKHITQCEAAKRLKISDRHIRRLLVELRKPTTQPMDSSSSVSSTAVMTSTCITLC